MNAQDIPEVRRPAEGRLRVYIPWRDGGNRKLIKSVCGARSRPEWDGQARRWLIARAHFMPLIEALKARFGQVRVITAHCDTEKCDIRCQEARGDDCVCSCGGSFHGGADSYTRRWILVGTTSLRRYGWSEREWLVTEGMSAAEMLAWIAGEGGRLTGEQLPVRDAEGIFSRFILRFGARDATRIARAAIEVHRGMWMGAPITPRRFLPSHDEFFARPILAGLDRTEGRRAA